MPQRDPQLPEGTDHIITGAMETGTGSGTEQGSDRAGGRGFIGSSDAGPVPDDTGGTAENRNNQGGTMARNISEGAANLKSQAGDRIRQFADDGKTRASDALDDFARVVEEAAGEIEDRLGDQYGGYARRAADAVSGLATNLREKDVDALYDDVGNFVRKSPGVAIGVAAALGFVLVRLVKAGIPDEGAEEGGRSRSNRSAPDVTTPPGTGA